MGLNGSCCSNDDAAQPPTKQGPEKKQNTPTGDPSVSHITTHNIDQRIPVVTMSHRTMLHTVECAQFGPGSTKFVTGTSSVVWPCAKLVATYLCEHPELVKGKRVLELGSGIGFVGLVAASLGASETVVTDAGDGMGLLELNVQRFCEKKEVKVSARELWWGNQQQAKEIGMHGFDVVLAADVIYCQAQEEIYQLAISMEMMLKLQNDAIIVLGYEYRNDWESFEQFQETLKILFLKLTPLELSEDEDEDHYMYIISRVEQHKH